MTWNITKNWPAIMITIIAFTFSCSLGGIHLLHCMHSLHSTLGPIRPVAPSTRHYKQNKKRASLRGSCYDFEWDGEVLTWVRVSFKWRIQWSHTNNTMTWTPANILVPPFIVLPGGLEENSSISMDASKHKIPGNEINDSPSLILAF